MRLAREEEQHRAIGVVHEIAQPLELVEHQRRALVGGEAPREADGEHVRVGRVGEAQQPVHVRLARLVAELLRAHPLLHQGQHARLQVLAHAPEDVVRELQDAVQARRIAQPARPAAAEEALEGIHPFRREEAWQVHPVGDVGDRVLALGHLGPEPREELGRDVAVDAAHAVLHARAARRERGHVEVAVARRLAELDQCRGIEPHLRAVAREVARDDIGREVVVAGGDRRMRGEDGVGGHRLERRARVHALLHVLAHALEHEEGRVPLVDVPHGGSESQRAQRPHAAHAEHDLLLDARRAIAPVEPVGGGAVLGRVGLQVGVEQVQRHAAHLRLPHAAMHVVLAELDAHLERRAVLTQDRQDRQVGEVVVGIDRVLHAFGVDGLREVALPVEQAHRHEGQRHVARGLAVVAGEDAEAARVDRQALVEAELRAEVGDQLASAEHRRLFGGGRAAVVRVEGGERAVVVVEEHRIARGFVEPALVHAPQQRLRVLPHRVPERRIEAVEERARGAVPAEPQVVRELLEARQRRGKPWRDVD